MHVTDVEAPDESHIVQRAGEMNARSEGAVYAGVLTAKQRGDFADTGAVDGEIHIDAARIGIPAAAEFEGSQTLGRPIGTRGPAFERNLPIAARSGRYIEVGLGQVEDAL